MSFDPFDPVLYTTPVQDTTPLKEEVEQPLIETNSREWSDMIEPPPDDVVEILDHYKNLKLSDREAAELRADLVNRNTLDLVILYDELRKLHKQLSEDPKDQLFLDIIQGEIESRGSDALAKGRAERVAELSASKQAIVTERQRIKGLADQIKRKEAIEALKQEEADYRRMINEFYTEWERVKNLGFEFKWLRYGPTQSKPSNPAPVRAKLDQPFQGPAQPKERPADAPKQNKEGLPGHSEFSRNPAKSKFAFVNPEALDINAEPEAKIITKKGVDYYEKKANRDIGHSRNHQSKRDYRTDKEKLLASMKEASVFQLDRLLATYVQLNETLEQPVNTEMIDLLREEIISRAL